MEAHQIRILIAGFLALQTFTIASCANRTFYFINNDGVTCSDSVGVLQVHGGSIPSSAKFISHNTTTFPNGKRCGVAWRRKSGTTGTIMSLSFRQTYPESTTCAASLTVAYLPHNTTNVFCGKNATNGKVSRDAFLGDLAMTFETQTGGYQSDWSFTVVLTPFTIAFGGCSESSFLCDGNRCVDKALVCDGDVNCADNSDESDVRCQSSITHQNKETSVSPIFDSLALMMLVIIAPLIGFMVIAMIIGIACMVYRRNRLERLYVENNEEGSNTAGELEEIDPNTTGRAKPVPTQ